MRAFLKLIFKIAISAVLLAIIIPIGRAIYVEWSTSQERNPAAIAAGYTDYRDQDKAAAAGFTNAVEWHNSLQQEQLKKEAEEKLSREILAAQKKAARAAEEELNRDPTTKMDIDLTALNKEGFGNVAIASVAITNSNEFGVRDIDIMCSFRGKSGTELSSIRYTIFDSMKAKSKKTFRDLNLGLINNQTAEGRCILMHAKRA